MSSYTLTVSFDADSLQQLLQAGLSVVVAKGIARQPHPLAWLMFKPFMENTIAWDDSISVYASEQELLAGSVINRNSFLPASSGNQYVFRNGVFTPSPKRTESAGYQMVNESGRTLTMGLSQPATVNGESVNGLISAETVPHGMMDEVIPLEELDVFLMSGTAPGTVLTAEGPLQTVRSQAIRVVFGNGVTSAGIRYDPSIGTFVRVS